MNTISINDVSPSAKINSFEDTAMYLNLMYHEIVEELLEAYTDFTDYDIIAELIDILHLPMTCVIEATRQGTIIHGYLSEVKA